MQCAQKAADARAASANCGFSPYAPSRAQRFVVRAPAAADELLRRLADAHNITGGLALSRYFPGRPNDILVCVTETNPRSEIDALVAGLAELTK